MNPKIILFAAATLMPVVLLAFGSTLGGVWLWVALAYLTVFTFALDELIGFRTNPGGAEGSFLAADTLSATLALAHFVLLGLGVWVVSGAGTLGAAERLVAFFAFGLFFGQVSNSNAHELIHRTRRPLFALGKWVFISNMFGHHTSAHRFVHHIHVATPQDPNSARQGESFYHFAPRAWAGSFRAGLAAENARRGGGMHPYISYVGGAALMLVFSAMIGGVSGVFAHLALAGYATMQILLSDYVQHYGLHRSTGAGGKPEPVSPRHSWNTQHWFSSLLMLNAPRHSDHHTHPTRPYPALELPDSYPVLPRSLPVMGFIALNPWRWRRVMNPRVAALTGPQGQNLP